ncbi:hypothetical protein DFH27DRAFT_624006 [Peziza echinospora]|nr:hypothetical protein DFH27DRAFT_624006 [Peziza echinospora]
MTGFTSRPPKGQSSLPQRGNPPPPGFSSSLHPSHAFPHAFPHIISRDMGNHSASAHSKEILRQLQRSTRRCRYCSNNQGHKAQGNLAVEKECPFALGRYQKHQYRQAALGIDQVLALEMFSPWLNTYKYNLSYKLISTKVWSQDTWVPSYLGTGRLHIHEAGLGCMQYMSRGSPSPRTSSPHSSLRYILGAIEILFFFFYLSSPLPSPPSPSLSPSLSITTPSLSPSPSSQPKNAKNPLRNRQIRGSRTNFQASYGLTMAPGDIEQGNAILDALHEQDAIAERELELESESTAARAHNQEPASSHSAWVSNNRARYESNGRSFMKEATAAQLAEEYEFEPTGDPEMDIMIAIGLRDMEERGEIEPSAQRRAAAAGGNGSRQSNAYQYHGDAEPAAAQNNDAGFGGETRSRRQQKRDRQREQARAHNMRREA